MQKFLQCHLHKNLKEKNLYKTGSPLKDGNFTIKKSGSDFVVDGPFAESKETLITGYFIIEAPNAEEAIEIAKGCPALTHGEEVDLFELGH